mgnify:CR=1 FL=1
MNYCDSCGQELVGSSCSFCGQQASKPASINPVQAAPPKSKRFRWLRSDRPKRYLAEMILVGSVVVLASFLVVPAIDSELANSESGSSPDGDMALNTGDSEEPSAQSGSEGESDWNYNEISRSFDSDGNPSQGAYSFSQWLETWDYSYDVPSILRGGICRESVCVQETLRVTFAPMSDYNLYSIKGFVRNTSGQRVTPAQSSFEIVEGDNEFVYQFVNESFVDLRQYPGNLFFRFDFSGFEDEYRIQPDNRILDLTYLLDD